MTDTFFADVSEWQAPVDDSYPYPVISIRSNDGTHRDTKWDNNYGWCKSRCDSGKLAFFLVYFVWRPNWQDAVDTLISLVGQPHPRMAIELDIETWGGQITGDQSDGINRAYWKIADWLGDPRRIGGYGNSGDLNALWRARPAGMPIRLAAYGANPSYPNKVAHQYTDGQGYGNGLPEGCAPFGRCDMNTADGLDPTALAGAYGIGAGAPPPPPPPPPVNLQQEIWDQLRLRWNMLGGHTMVEALAQIRDATCGTHDAGTPGVS